MQKTVKNNSYKESISSMPQYKTDFVNQKERLDRVPKEQKEPLKKEVETLSVLTANKARESLKNLDGWQLTVDHKMIYREFILQDFSSAIDLIDHIALIAEDEKHHPDLHLTQYRNLRVALTTHDVGGLSQKDFNVALKIKDLPILFNKPKNGVVIDHPSPKKDKPVQKSRLEQKNIQVKQRQSISLVPKKNNSKTKAIKTKRIINRVK